MCACECTNIQYSKSVITSENSSRKQASCISFLRVTMGIIAFLRYKIKTARCNRRRSPSNRKVKNYSRANSPGTRFDTEKDHHNKYCDNEDIREDLIENDGSVVRSFSWSQIENATKNFSQVIGYGGFSDVYLAHLPDAALGAIKIHSSTTQRLHRIFKQELDILLHIQHHEHIVKLLGFYDDQEKGVLVLEYVQNGTLQEKLHGDDEMVLSWTKRMQIAYQIVQAIEHLHESCSPHIVHGDIKSSNILLDDNFDCKLCDFGSAKMGFSSNLSLLPCKQHNNFTMMGSPGYVDPHYLKTGIASKKNDIYSFGVLLLELVTGKEAFSAKTGKMLKSLVENGTELVSDPHLNGNFDSEEATVMFSIARFCLDNSPTLRPSASDLLFCMQHQIPSIFAHPEKHH